MTTARTMTDAEINAGVAFYPAEPGDSQPCIELGGSEDGDGAVQVYAYAEDGVLYVSLHYDTAGPDESGRGPWAYYGPYHAVPTVIFGGDGSVIYAAVPDSSPYSQARRDPERCAQCRRRTDAEGCHLENGLIACPAQDGLAQLRKTDMDEPGGYAPQGGVEGCRRVRCRECLREIADPHRDHKLQCSQRGRMP